LTKEPYQNTFLNIENYRAKISRKNIEVSCQEVKQAVFTLIQKEEYPSEARVSQLISQPGNFRYKQVRIALKEARSKNSF